MWWIFGRDISFQRQSFRVGRHDHDTSFDAHSRLEDFAIVLWRLKLNGLRTYREKFYDNINS